MNDKRRTGFFHLIDAVSSQREAAKQLDLGIGWAGGKYALGPPSEEHTELLEIQKEMDNLIRRMGGVISLYEGEKYDRRG